MTDEEIQRLQEENAELRQEVEKLKNELIRLVSRNLDLSERLEEDQELRRRTEVARELLEGNIERQRNADLKDDAQLMALIELRVEQDRPHLQADFDTAALARLLGVSQERLNRLFRHQTIHRTPRGLHRQSACAVRPPPAPREASVEHRRRGRGVGHRQCAHPAAPHPGGCRHDSGGIPPHAHPGFIEFSGGVFVSDNTPPLGLESGGTGPPDFCP